ncbi:hypothetical protein ACN27J_26345 [Solwaraspora sp. WMMB762]|uniref:hypothetical protein n=1 Tax=Solwaraspora sp. WMMB762 TaxID=3404120 RepID=UPI003B957D3D
MAEVRCLVGHEAEDVRAEATVTGGVGLVEAGDPELLRLAVVAVVERQPSGEAHQFTGGAV